MIVEWRQGIDEEEIDKEKCVYDIMHPFDIGLAESVQCEHKQYTSTDCVIVDT